MLCLSSRSTPYSTDPREYKKHEVSEGKKRKKGLTFFVFNLFIFLKWQQVFAEQKKRTMKHLCQKLDFFLKRKRRKTVNFVT